MLMSTSLFTITLNVPAGYQLTFTSWENDGDHYKTTVIQGLSKPDAEFYIELAKMFSSVNDLQDQGMGNNTNSDLDLRDAINELLERHPNISDDEREFWSEESEEQYNDLWYQLCDTILGRPVDYDDHGFCRVVESIQVHLISEPIVDVTDQFN
mgnify:CR=1 FL=1